MVNTKSVALFCLLAHLNDLPCMHKYTFCFCKKNFFGKHININNKLLFCSLFPIFFNAAIMGRIIDRDSRNEPNRFAKDSPYQSAKFNINIQAVFKKSQDSASTTARKTVPLIVSAKDLECRCPKLKPNR